MNNRIIFYIYFFVPSFVLVPSEFGQNGFIGLDARERYKYFLKPQNGNFQRKFKLVVLRPTTLSLHDSILWESKMKNDINREMYTSLHWASLVIVKGFCSLISQWKI